MLDDDVVVFPAWLPWASAAMVGGLLAVLLAEVRHPTPSHPELPDLWVVQELQPGDASTTCLGDAGMEESLQASAQNIPRAGVPTNALGVPMPKKPFPGQRRPPCEPRGETAINGACWVQVADEKAPCGPKLFDYEGRCYMIAVDFPRQPTSEQP